MLSVQGMQDTAASAPPAEGTVEAQHLTCSVGVMAYNEEANIGHLLAALLDQETHLCRITEIIVLASGCTDGTEAIVQSFAERDERVKLIVQPTREGKASAINLFLRHARSDIVVLESADTVPDRRTIERLVAPFADPEVGMTGGHPVPVNSLSTTMGFVVALLWQLHHEIALTTPKLGELTAVRRIFHRIPRDSAVDEANMEPLVRGQGYELRYVPEAIVYNRGPESVADFLKQRRRIYAGHLKMRRQQGYVVATMSKGRIVRAMARSWRWERRYVTLMPFAIGLEVYARLLGWMDYHFKKRDHAVWEIAATTKGSIK